MGHERGTASPERRTPTTNAEQPRLGAGPLDTNAEQPRLSAGPLDMNAEQLAWTQDTDHER
ncbi:hypothetical protein GCM10027286_22660 [Virgibacillus ainsalahensis]